MLPLKSRASKAVSSTKTCQSSFQAESTRSDSPGESLIVFQHVKESVAAGVHIVIACQAPGRNLFLVALGDRPGLEKIVQILVRQTREVRRR
jgi:hypothetical protein